MDHIALNELRRVLVVEDESKLAQNYEKLFQLKGCEARHALDGKTAIELLEDFEPDLILLDLNLGIIGRNGLDILPTLLAKCPSSCVIVFTGVGSVESAVKALQLGAWHMLEKKATPFEDLFTIVVTIRNRKLEFDRMRDAALRNIEHQARMNSTLNLANGVAHDVKNRVSHLSVLTSFLESSNATREQMQWIESLRSSIRLLDSSVTQLYEFSKIQKMICSSVSFREVIESSTQQIKQRLASEHRQMISISSNFADDALVESNSSMLAMAVNNVIDNAVDSIGKSKGCIKLSLLAVDGAAEFFCCDDGPGFSSEGLERADMPFFTTKGKSNHGNGLAFTKEVVVSCGGSISFGNNKDGPGAWVKISLPISSIDPITKMEQPLSIGAASR